MATNKTTKQPIPLRYPGGKYYALGILKPFWAYIPHDEYREPFAGGASVFFTKHKVKYNWLNDIDSELVNTYQIMSIPAMRQKLVEMVRNEEASKERWKEILNFQPANALEAAYKYFYLNRTSFSGKLSSAAWGYRPKRSLPPNRWFERIIPCGEKLENVKLTCVDFEQVVLEPSVGKSTLLFVDPPYYSPPKNKHYRNGFDNNDHFRLRDTLKKTPHNFFLTYDNIPEIKELYDWAYITEVKFFYRVENAATQQGLRRLGFELIITNYEPPKQLSFDAISGDRENKNVD